jgi:hypothetical protein
MPRPSGLRIALDAAAGVLVPLALSRVDFLVERLPSLGLLRGRAAYALVGLGLGVALVRARGDASNLVGAVARARWWVLLAGTFLAFASAGLHYASGIPPSGDEPHYLVMAQSLWRDHDLDLRDEYEGEEWREYTPGPIRPHWGAPRADGRPFPAHSPGLPALLAPAYGLGGRAAAVLLMAILGAAAAVVARQLALDLTGDREAAAWAWLAAAGPPLAFYSFLFYTEAPSALFVSLALLLLLRPRGAAGAALAAAAASALPWLHLKMLPAAAALGLVALVRLRGWALATFATAALAAATCFAAYYASVFGVASPLAIYGGMPEDARVLTWRAPAGLLLDRSFGLLPMAPVFLLALAGVAAVRGRRAAWPHALVAAAVLVPALSWRMWWGGQCPPARFLVPLVPLLAVAIAVRRAPPRHGLAHWTPAVAALGFGLATVAVAEPGARLLLNFRNRPTRLWAALSGDVAIADYIPSLTHPSPRDTKVALVWLVATVTLLVLDRLAAKRPRVDRLFTSFSAAIGLVLLAVVSIDLLAPSPAAAPPAVPAEHASRSNVAGRLREPPPGGVRSEAVVAALNTNGLLSSRPDLRPPVPGGSSDPRRLLVSTRPQARRERPCAAARGR